MMLPLIELQYVPGAVLPSIGLWYDDYNGTEALLRLNYKVCWFLLPAYQKWYNI